MCLMSRLTVVGVTGGIACGKSVFGHHLRQRYGAVVIDCDIISREVVSPGGGAYSAVREAFPECFHPLPDGRANDPPVLDRDALGDLVFRDGAARRRLNRLVHPAVARRLLWLVVYHRLLKWERLVVIDAPLLLESGPGLLLLCAPVVVVACSEERQKNRVLERDGHTAERALRRIEAQWSTAEKVARADVVVDSDHDDPAVLTRAMERAARREILPALGL